MVTRLTALPPPPVLARTIREKARYQFKMDRRVLSPVQLAAITRIYGDHGAEILELLRKNPCKTVPVILARLRQKDVEWRVVSCRVLVVFDVESPSDVALVADGSVPQNHRAGIDYRGEDFLHQKPSLDGNLLVLFMPPTPAGVRRYVSGHLCQASHKPSDRGVDIIFIFRGALSSSRLCFVLVRLASLSLVNRETRSAQMLPLGQ